MCHPQRLRLKRISSCVPSLLKILPISMASAQLSQDRRGRDGQDTTLWSPRPHCRSESRHLSSRRHAAKAVTHVRDDLCRGGMHVGDAIQVFSRAARAWVDAEITKIFEGNFVRLEYEAGEYWCGKTLHILSEHLIIYNTLVRVSSDQELEEQDPGCIAASGPLRYGDPRLNGVPPDRWCVNIDDVKEFIEKIWVAHGAGCITQGITDSHDDRFNAKHDDLAVGPNMHDVNEAIIKPTTRVAGGVSWALMKHARGRNIKIFVSHNWSEGAYEFWNKLSSSIQRKPKAQRQDLPGIWICFLSNPQTWEQGDLGALLQPIDESPFALALAAKPSKVLALPCAAEPIYARLWCVEEAKRAIDIGLIVEVAAEEPQFHSVSYRRRYSGARKVRECEDLARRQIATGFRTVRSAKCSNPGDERLIRNSMLLPLLLLFFCCCRCCRCCCSCCRCCCSCCCCRCCCRRCCCCCR